MSTDVLDPTDETTSTVTGEVAEPRRRRSNLLPALVLAVGLLGAAFVLRPGADAGDAPATSTTVAAGPTVALDPMTLNLDGGSLLRIGVAVELAEGVDVDEFNEHGSANRLKDLIVFEVAGLRAEQLASRGGLDELKASLTEGAEELYGEEFHGLYLTELVVQ